MDHFKIINKFRCYEILLFLLLLSEAFAYEKESRCLTEKSNILTISCPANKITRIIKAFYGYSWSGDCHHIEKDCVVDVPNDDLSCLGEGCSVRIIDSPIILQECWSLMASYIQVDYECISVDQLQNMCNVQESEYPVGYIVTPEYPSSLRSELSCPCTLQAPHGYTITMEVLDFRMSSCSQTGLTVWSDSSTYTHCMSLSTGILPGSGGQNISMRLHSQSERSNSGFLLKYYATPQEDNVNVKFVCYGSSQMWRTSEIEETTATTTTERQTTTTTTERKPLIHIEKTTSKAMATSVATTKAWTTRLVSSIEHIHNLVTNTTATRPTATTTTTPEPETTTVTEAIKNFTEAKVTDRDRNSEFTKSFKILDFKDDKFSDWTVLIISIVASVIFLLVMINALIWFIFSIKSNKKSKKRKDLPVTLYTSDPYNQDYFNKPLGSDDLYMASQVGLNTVNNNNNTSLNPNGSALVKKDNALWKSSESLNVFGNRFQAEQGLPTTTWPRIATEPGSQSMPYIFSFDKLKMPYNKKYKLSKEEKKRIKEWEFLQELRMKKIKDDEMQHFLCNVGDLNPNGKYLNESKQDLDSANELNKKQKNVKLNPKGVPIASSGNFENPALILDDERNNDYNMKTTSINSTEQNFHFKKAPPNFNKIDNVHETRYHHNIQQNHDYGDNMSRDESVLALSDTLMLKSASQVPMNAHNPNPNYMYEEQEGSIDLRSEYSFYHKNAAAANIKKNALNAQNINKKTNDESKAFCEYKDISSWKDVY